MTETKRKIFISFSYTDRNKQIKENLAGVLEEEGLIIDKSEREDKSQHTDETIWKHLEKRIKGSTITIVLLTKDLFEENKHKLDYSPKGFLDSGWIYNEISASLRNWNENKINGIIAVYESDAETYIQQRVISSCLHCNGCYTTSIVLSAEIIKKNKFNINPNFKTNKNCEQFSLEKDSFISLVSLEDFKKEPSRYIKIALEKREKQINDNNYFKIEYNLHSKDKK